MHDPANKGGRPAAIGVNFGHRLKADGVEIDLLKFAKGLQEGLWREETGLQYKVLAEQTAPIPTANDQVVCHYTDKFTSGQVFDSSIKRGELALMPVSGVLPDWTEALLTMKAAFRWEITIPPVSPTASRARHR